MIGRKHFALALLATCANGPVQAVEPGGNTGAVARGAEPLKTAMLRGHAEARAALGLPPLSWDERLAASARAHAEEMAHTGRYAHAVQPMDKTRQGENLWIGPRGTFGYDEMVETWLAERRNFVNQPAPGFSRSGRWQDAAHYAQIVWRGTTALGCAMASDVDIDFLVCRYAPAGNVVGQRVF